MAINKREEHFLYDLPEKTIDGDAEDRFVQKVILAITDGDQIQREDEDKLDKIQADWDNAFNTDGVEGDRYSYSHETATTTINFVKKLAFPRFGIGYVSKKSNLNIRIDPKKTEAVLEKRRLNMAILKKGIEKIMKDSSVYRAFKGKAGTNLRFSLFGDGFIILQTQETGFPFRLISTTSQNIFFNSEANSVRDSADGHNATMMVILYDLSYDQFRDMHKDVKGPMKEKIENLEWGILPATIAFREDRDVNRLQDTVMARKRMGQMAYIVDIQEERIVKIAGSKSTIIEDSKGKSFPFKFENGDTYLPVFHFRCFDRWESLRNFGLGHFMSGINDEDFIVKNKNVRSVLEVVTGMKVMRVGAGKVNEVQSAFFDAEENAASGHMAVALIEEDESGENSILSIEDVSGKQAPDSANLVYRKNDDDVTKLGINVREVAPDPRQTAEGIRSSIASSDSLAQFVQSQNVPEYRFMVEVIIDASKKHIKPDSRHGKQFLNTSDIFLGTDEESSLPLEGVTLGDVIGIMKENHIEVIMDEESGVKPNSVLRRTLLRDNINIAGVDTKAGRRISRMLLAADGLDFPMNEFELPQQADAQGNPVPQDVRRELPELNF